MMARKLNIPLRIGVMLLVLLLQNTLDAQNKDTKCINLLNSINHNEELPDAKINSYMKCVATLENSLKEISDLQRDIKNKEEALAKIKKTSNIKIEEKEEKVIEKDKGKREVEPSKKELESQLKKSKNRLASIKTKNVTTLAESYELLYAHFMDNNEQKKAESYKKKRNKLRSN